MPTVADHDPLCRGSELVVFDGCAHAPISEDPAAFNRRTLEFLLRQR